MKAVLIVFICVMIATDNVYAQRTLVPHVELFKVITNGGIPPAVAYMDYAGGVGAYGAFDSAYIYNSAGTQVVSKVLDLHNTIRQVGSTWVNAGNALVTSPGYQTLFHTTLYGEDYVAVEQPPYLRKLNSSTNTFEDIPEFSCNGVVRRAYEWGGNKILITGDFDSVNSTKTRFIAIWDRVSHAVTTTFSGNAKTADTKYIPSDSILYIGYQDIGISSTQVSFIQKGSTTLIPYLPLQSQRFYRVEVVNPNQLYVLIGTNSQVFELHRFQNGAWSKLATFTPVSYPSLIMRSIEYHNNLLYIAGAFTEVNAQPRNGMIIFNEATGSSENIAPLPANVCCSYNILGLYWLNNRLYIPSYEGTIAPLKSQTLYILNDPSVLPLQLLDFSLKTTINGNTLLWKTAQEVNTDFFDIERSNNGRTFTNIGTVVAAGTSFTERQYSFNDRDPLQGTSYYRLHVLDKDGKGSYSAIKTIVNTKAFSAHLLSNPVKDVANFEIYTQKSESLQVRITTTEGKLIKTMTWNVNKGVTNQSVTMYRYAPGIYYINVISSQGSNMVKILKQQ